MDRAHPLPRCRRPRNRPSHSPRPRQLPHQRPDLLHRPQVHDLEMVEDRLPHRPGPPRRRPPRSRLLKRRRPRRAIKSRNQALPAHPLSRCPAAPGPLLRNGHRVRKSSQSYWRKSMHPSRREFLAKSSLGIMAAALNANSASAQQPPTTPGAPPAFGTSPPVGPAVSVETFVEAEKLVQIKHSEKDLAEAAGNWRESMAGVYERRVGPRKLLIEETIPPATVWNPTLPGTASRPTTGKFSIAPYPVPGLPASETDIAFSPV